MLAFATAASATRNLSMTGEWYQNRGPLIDIPTAGGQSPCGGGAPNGCINNLKPVNGGIPGAATVPVAPGPAPSFTVPPNAFNWVAGKQVAAVPFVPTVVQLSSTWTIMGPVTLSNTKIPAPNRPAAFMKNAWLADPGQANRLQKEFTWCFGVTATTLPQNCTNSKAGPYTGMITYKNPNPNAFGGTMELILSGNGVVSVIVGANLLGHAIAGPGVPGNPQHPGRGYASFDTDMLQSGDIHYGFATNPPCTQSLPAYPIGCGQITASGPVVGTLPADVQMNWGFPWTTGTVTAMNVQTNQQQPGTTTLTGMGSDSRTAWGAGKITLVSGGATRRVGYSQDYSAVDVVNMTFAPPVPSMSTPGLAAGGLLILLAVGYAVRRRF